ncbi:Putative Outer membrane protein and related peptidoglycan-associated lipo protein(Outer membrane protein, OmpA/MotB, C-terminal,172-279;Outer membrane protein, OmpA/MotB, C-terminal,316-381) [Magnetospirillum sp. XM-1]|uniref:OmpA family protein n=1 Tax=Magnetospirillum sp. XM-1 TaxID=1663591 RepID=UPI00073DD8F7|nr:OmpA family protein [Magnetospirillum sp. XM-1]CUW38523.1 Putative Outer membrane protein and related peptidoglycan-associated lipo protein(Outer membrane protein, OmpA/MotB, C-terminal,172-279;Outer membrane protein, OmpA/MotB, C-terminal,316-381) [Magnetospirillum sp. XM-1]
MKKITRWAGLGAAAALAACATPADVSDVYKVLASPTPAGTPFTQALFQEYKAYTLQQAVPEVEWRDASLTARKALRVAAGEVVQPDELTLRPIPGPRQPELGAARGRLVSYLASGATERVPAAAAKAQVAFDCWLEQEAEGNAAAPCRTTFLAHEPMLKKPAPTNAMAAEVRRSFSVAFDSGSAKLSSQALQTVKEAAAAQAQFHAPMVSVTGHTDTVGTAEANMRLARHRADAVAGALAKEGVPPGMISEAALGEGGLAVATPDNKGEAKNRRVEIALSGTPWSRGYGYGGYAYGDRAGYGHGWGNWGHNAYVVFFTPGSSRLGTHDIERLKAVVAAQKDLKPKSVRVIGFTDSTGSAATNTRLARERAQAVAAEIGRLGGSAAAVESAPGGGWGPGHDGRARRVEILFDF